MRKIPANKLPELYAALSQTGPLWLPVQENGRVEFALWKDGSDVNLDGKTGRSGKDFFFPQTEDYVSFRTDGRNIEIIERDRPDQPFTVFGMRACDVAAMGVLDRVFLVDPRDSFYEARRNAGTVVALGCTLPDESCFCQTFKVDAAQPGADVDAWILGDTLYWRENTDKGKTLGEKVASLFTDASADEEKAVQAEQERVRALVGEMPLSNVKTIDVPEEKLEDWFDWDKWQSLSESCLGCGACTFVCPTCQCYDIQDRESGDGIRRFRCWDSCMYSDFTLMAHGNIRNTQMQRFRQRFMHKLVYYPQNNEGVYSCVGCGRCVEKCPSATHIVKVIRAMEGNKNV